MLTAGMLKIVSGYQLYCAGLDFGSGAEGQTQHDLKMRVYNGMFDSMRGVIAEVNQYQDASILRAALYASVGAFDSLDRMIYTDDGFEQERAQASFPFPSSGPFHFLRQNPGLLWYRGVFGQTTQTAIWHFPYKGASVDTIDGRIACLDRDRIGLYERFYGANFKEEAVPDMLFGSLSSVFFRIDGFGKVNGNEGGMSLLPFAGAKTVKVEEILNLSLILQLVSNETVAALMRINQFYEQQEQIEKIMAYAIKALGELKHTASNRITSIGLNADAIIKAIGRFENELAKASTSDELTRIIEQIKSFISRITTRAGEIKRAVNGTESILDLEYQGYVVDGLHPRVEIEGVDVKEIVASAMRKYNLETALEGELIIYSDKRVLEYIFMEVFSNVVKYGGSQAAVVVEPSDGKVILTIEDQGQGFDEQEIRSGVFAHNGFKSCRNPSGLNGTGMGLFTVAAKIVELAGELRIISLGGEVRVSASNGRGIHVERKTGEEANKTTKGSVFMISLPVGKPVESEPTV